MRSVKYIFFLLTVLFSSCSDPETLSRIDLSQGWEFRREGDSVWRPAIVPGVVHTDLMSLGEIPDPWIGTNELDVQWVENENWEYRLQFNLDDDQISYQNLDLVFDGLDTYAEVFLNDSLVLAANNMFRSWRVAAKHLLAEENEILIRFISPIIRNRSQVQNLPYQLPASSESVDLKVSPFVRKAPYHFGWDWGPRLVTSGIWRPVYLEAWNTLRIDDIYIKQLFLSDTIAQLEGIIEVYSVEQQLVEVRISEESQKYQLQKGTNKIALPFEILEPKMWWPNGWGDPHQYEIPVSIVQDKILLAADTVSTGLRTVELVQEEDSIGRSFYFLVNGQPLFARGANYIPQSHFLPSIDADQYERLIKQAHDAGMNMIRVWGGGIYENDLFYNLCDQYGITVWQDFMFAGTVYPGDSSFFDNVEKEVEENVRRLRNHPSIVHWNGNNEIDVAWKNWGWQDQYQYSVTDSTKIWNDYITLFHQKIPAILNRLDDRPYTPTSPLSNWGTKENFNFGSMHYWGVWHGQDQFEDYASNVGRFMSEYGFQSFPSIETINYFAEESDYNLESETLRHHQKSYVGNGIIYDQATKYFGEPDSFISFVKKSQRTQAKAMQMAIDAHRLAKGHCWGSLFWQLNDCWPGPSWSAIDVFGREKIFYKDLKFLFAPVALIPKWEGNRLKIVLINDTLDEVAGSMRLEFADGTEKETLISAKGNGSLVVFNETFEDGKRKGDLSLLINDTVVFRRPL